MGHVILVVIGQKFKIFRVGFFPVYLQMIFAVIIS